jgi:hypothetical protein
LAALALLAIVPAGRMPGFTPGDLPEELSTGGVHSGAKKQD